MDDFCPECGNLANDNKLVEVIKKYNIPFVCSSCGSLKFKYKAIRDVVFLWPLPKPARYGQIELVEDDNFHGGNLRSRIHEYVGIVLSVGPGAYDKEGKFRNTKSIKVGDAVFYYSKLPPNWNYMIEDDSEKLHRVIYCGYPDIVGLAE